MKLLIVLMALVSVSLFAEPTRENVCGEFYIPVNEVTLVRDLLMRDTILVFAEDVHIPANVKEIELGSITIQVPIKSYDRYLAKGLTNPYQLLGTKHSYPAALYLRGNVRLSFERPFNDKFDVGDFERMTDEVITICTKKQAPQPI